ncbi:MAG: hypothetical protein Q4G08_11395 [Capnocytophaga sp.]|nr:hypothetical protein [Capnocytophaga sp.]
MKTIFFRACPPKKEELLSDSGFSLACITSKFSSHHICSFFLGSGFPLQYTRENAFFARPAAASSGRPRSVGKKQRFASLYFRYNPSRKPAAFG